MERQMKAKEVMCRKGRGKGKGRVGGLVARLKARRRRARRRRRTGIRMDLVILRNRATSPWPKRTLVHARKRKVRMPRLPRRTRSSSSSCTRFGRSTVASTGVLSSSPLLGVFLPACLYSTNLFIESCTRASALFYTPFPEEGASPSSAVLSVEFPVPVIDFTVGPDGDVWTLFDAEWAGAHSSSSSSDGPRFARLLSWEGSTVRRSLPLRAQWG